MTRKEKAERVVVDAFLLKSAWSVRIGFPARCIPFLSEVDGGTLIKFQHSALGFVSADHKAGMDKGWNSMHERVRRQAEAG